MGTVAALTPQARTALYHRFPAPATEWVVKLARERGWQEANRRYLESMRKRGAEEMQALMRDVGVEPPLSDEDALELLEAAFAVYIPEARTARARGPHGRPALEVEVKDCPTYARIEQSDWHGVTACGSWHRRSGWYEVLRMTAVDTVVGEKKWGDAACAALIELGHGAAEPA